MSTASEGPDADTMNPEETAEVVLAEIKKLQKEIAPPLQDTNLYEGSSAVNALQVVDQAIAGVSAAPPGQMIKGFQAMIEGDRLDGLLDALVSSSGHPALQHACLIVMCGVVSLPQAHGHVTKRRDVQKALLGALANPKPRRISPGDEEDELCVNPAVGAAICLNSFLVSCGGLSKETAKIWVEVDGLSAIASAVESHSAFAGGGDEDVLPAMLFGLATPLLLYMKEDKTNKVATTTDAEAEQTSKDVRQRLAEAFLRLLVERREWVARSLAIAANTSLSDLSCTATPPAPVTMNNLFVETLAHPDLLGAYTGRAPVRLRAQTVAASRACETEGKFAQGFAEQLARLLILSGQQERNARVATGALGKVRSRMKGKQEAVVKCGRPSCGKREANRGRKFKVCSRCQSTLYCSEECQGVHWKEGHKGQCRRTASSS